MDKNRLVQIANHFDKIGAYTISDEFENKFIRMAAPVDEKLLPRDSKVTSRSKQTPAKSVLDFFTDFRKNFNLLVRSPEDVVQMNQNTWNLITTWNEVFFNFYTDPIYTSDLKKLDLIKKISREIFLAEDNFKAAKPSSVRSGESHKGKKAEILNFANAEQTLLQLFVKFVDLENEKYGNANNSKYHPYLNNLRVAETLLYNLDALSSNNDPLPLPKTPATTTPATTTPATTGGGSTAPSVSPSKPSSKNTNLSVNEELAKIVFRKLRASSSKLTDEKVLFENMREKNKYIAYLDISKDLGLKGSIRAAIKESSFSSEFKQELYKRLDAKIAKAIELSKPISSTGTPGAASSGTNGTNGTAGTGATSQSGTGSTPEPPKDPAKPDADGFRCTREGLFTEIGRMDNLHNNDPISYMRSYFANIKRVIDCHESLRNSLNLKDNTQLDSLINILEAKYFSEINKTQFPY